MRELLLIMMMMASMLMLVSKDMMKILMKMIRGAIQIAFRKKLGIWPNKGGGGLTEAQVFVENFQNQICLGKWPEM